MKNEHLNKIKKIKNNKRIISNDKQINQVNLSNNINYNDNHQSNMKQKMNVTKNVPKLNLESEDLCYKDEKKDLYLSNSSRDEFKLNTVKFKDLAILNEIK